MRRTKAEPAPSASPGTRFTAALLLQLAAAAVLAQPCPDTTDLLLTNGRIHTMADEPGVDPVVFSSIHIVGGRVDRLGPPGIRDMGQTACTNVIDLKGHTVVPGLIDNHNHIVLLGLRPGYDTRLESARSVGEALAMLAARAAEVPQDAWITAIGGFDLPQLVPESAGGPAAPGRFPTLAEIDRAVPDHPVYLQISFTGPGATNSLGKAFLESRGVEVGDDGSIAGGGFGGASPATEALYALNQQATPADHKRNLLHSMRYGASLGLTTHLDEGGFPASGTPADGAAHFDIYTAYEPLLALHDEGAMLARVRINFLYMEADPATPELVARLKNAFPHFGDSMLKTLGIGEFTAGTSAMITQATPEWVNGTRRVAEAGWRNENHSLTQTDFKVIIDGWEKINAELPAPGITELRWVVAHVPFITREYADKLEALGGGVNVLGGWRYISGTAQQNGPPFRMLAESGIHMGMSSDGMQISPMNPWLGLYYVVTGRNVRGELINAGQTLSRYDALALYTQANGWFLSEEDDLGTLEPGKYADLVVLSKEYFDETAVPDEAIKGIQSLLTLVGGKIVYGDPKGL